MAQNTPKPTALTEKHVRYDDHEHLITMHVSNIGYHTTLKPGLKVHSIIESLNYALEILDSHDDTLLERACAILRKVLPLQDKNPASKTFGLWSWFYEEPLDRMSPPDWNWADFCGTTLLQVKLRHALRLPAPLLHDIDQAIQFAARSVERRNMGPWYTNIAILGSYVTLIAAELYHLDDLQQYAVKRIRGIYDHTLEQGGFTEFNSPNYTIISLNTLGMLRRDARNPEARQLIEALYHLIWKEIADHFHVPTWQWAGPHSRSYQSLLPRSTLDLISRGTRVVFGQPAPEPEGNILDLPCPPDLLPLFQQLPSPRMVTQRYSNADIPRIGSTYLHPQFCLGTINWGNFWNQCRSLLAYWGTALNPGYAHLRFLHNGYDFAAAQFYSSQHQGHALVGINFAADGGDTHPSLDKIKNAKFKATDLRLRLELGGLGKTATLQAPAQLTTPVTIKLDSITLTLSIARAQWGSYQGRYEITQTFKRDQEYNLTTELEATNLDVVLYHGEEREFDLNAINEAALALTLAIDTNTNLPAQPQAQIAQGRLDVQWENLHLNFALKPDTQQQLQAGIKFS